MIENLAWGANLAVLGFFLGIAPLLPRERTWARALVIGVTLALWTRYMYWRFTATAPNEFTFVTGLFFYFGLGVELMITVGMIIFSVTMCRFADRSSEADRNERWLRSLPPERLPDVDVFLTTYNEGREFVERGIVAAKAMDYPRFTVWVLDDGRRDWLRDLCAERGVEYVRRPDNKHAKAGNVNHAFGITKAELFAVFDADFTPHRNFLYRTVGFFFADPRITIVQTPQHFYNADVFQNNLGLSEVMQDNEREWYDAVLASRDAWDRAFCCGTSAVFRRDAMQRIGGLATDSVTEDILTTVKMLPDGYITRYLNERLSLGLAPEDAKSLLIQRRRWVRGGIQLMYLMIRRYAATLSFRDWLFFMPIHYFLDFPCRILFALLPLVYLWTGFTHFYVQSTAELVAFQGPSIIACFFSGRWLIPHARAPLVSAATSLYLSARTYPTVISSLIKPFGEPFRVTPKGKKNVTASGDPLALWELVALIVATIGGIIFGCGSSWNSRSRTGLVVATSWSLCNLVLFGLTLLAMFQRSCRRQAERFPVRCRSTLVAEGVDRACTIVNVSLSGALLDDAGDLRIGDSIVLRLEGLGDLPATVVRRPGECTGIQFDGLSQSDRDKLIVYLYASGLTNQVREISPLRIIWRLLSGTVAGAA